MAHRAFIITGSDDDIADLVCLYKAADIILERIQVHKGGPAGMKGLRINLRDNLMDTLVEYTMRNAPKHERRAIRLVLASENSVDIEATVMSREREVENKYGP